MAPADVIVVVNSLCRCQCIDETGFTCSLLLTPEDSSGGGGRPTPCAMRSKSTGLFLSYRRCYGGCVRDRDRLGGIKRRTTKRESAPHLRGVARGAHQGTHRIVLWRDSRQARFHWPLERDQSKAFLNRLTVEPSVGMKKVQHVGRQNATCCQNLKRFLRNLRC